MKNFRKYKHAFFDAKGFPYDKSSLMHYHNFAFSKNGRMTLASKTNRSEALGRDDGFSKLDIGKLNAVYCSK